MKRNSILFYFLLFIPVFNVVADVTIYFFREPGGDQFHLGLIRGGFLSILGVWFILRGYQTRKESIAILLFLVYTLILSLFSSDIKHSIFSGYLKWFGSFLLFPISYWIINDERKLKILLQAYLIVAAIICINLLSAQFTKFGITTYLEDTFYTGGAGVGITNNLSIIILCSVLLYDNYRNSRPQKIIFFGIIFLSFVFVLLSLKRAAILGLLIGLITFLFLSTNKVKVLKNFIILVFVFIIAFPLFDNILLPRLDARLNELETIEEEGRIKDMLNVVNEFKEGDISLVLFGTEAFNSRQFYGPKYFGRERAIHGDFTTILYGNGIIGLFFYSYIFILLFYWIFRKRSVRSPLLRRLLISYLAVLICFLLISITGSGSVGFLCLVFIFLGSAKRVFEEVENKSLHEKDHSINRL